MMRGQREKVGGWHILVMSKAPKVELSVTPVGERAQKQPFVSLGCGR